MDVAGRLRQLWRRYRSSLLFVPSLMLVGAIVLFATTTYADRRLGETLAAFTIESGNPMLAFLVFAGSADSASRLLASITGTWATIAGVVYSVTLVTIQLSATKYSAQVIPVFERDRLNQVVLGTFTATFGYSLLVLKTIRSDNGEFVPVIGVNVAILLALVSLALLIVFIGNLTAYIRPTRFVEDYAQRGFRELPRLLEPAGQDGFEPTSVRDSKPPPDAVKVHAQQDGYVAKIDWSRLREEVLREGRAIERVDVVVALGEFVTKDNEVLRALGEDLDEDVADGLAAAVEVAKVPDDADPDRVAETLADIGVTSLSGGATDVGVAKSALRELLALTARALDQDDPGPAFEMADEEGRSATLVRVREAFHNKSLHEARRILTKGSREGYWDLAEHFTMHVGSSIRHAARSPRQDTWTDLLEWMRALVPTLFDAGDVRSSRRIVANLRRVAQSLREDGRPAQADDLEALLRDAAFEAGAEEALSKGDPHSRSRARAG